MGNIFPFPNLGYFPDKTKNTSSVCLSCLWQRVFGSFSEGLCIHGAPMSQHDGVPYIILSNTQCVRCTFIHTCSVLIRCKASRDSQSHLSASGRKAGEVSLWFFLCRLMLGSSQLNPSRRCDVQPPRKQLAHNHSALCFHDCSQAHIVYVSGAYVTQYNGRSWAYYFFFPLFVLWPERNRGIDVFTLSRFPYPRSYAQIL